MELRYHVVDVFTQVPLEGNALAVFPDARTIDGALMQRIARELNLSETTFVLPPRTPEGAARVRIFTPVQEMVFAGHPTIGTAYVILREGIVAAAAREFVLEENVGPVKVRVEEDSNPLIWLETPNISFGPTFEPEQCARVLGLQHDDLVDGIPCQIVSAGNPNLYIPLRDRDAVDRIVLDTSALSDLLRGHPDPICVFAFAAVDTGAYSRMFAPALGVAEDPATGSATGPLAAFMMRHDLAPTHDGATFMSEQGTKMGRRSLLHIRLRGDHGRTAIEVGGHVAPVGSATMTLDPSLGNA